MLSLSKVRCLEVVLVAEGFEELSATIEIVVN